MTSPAPQSRLALWLALLVHVVLGLALIAAVPLTQAPDEEAHWQNVQYIVSQHALPVFRGEVPPTPGYEYHQPPLYYVLCAPFWAVLGAVVQNYACRVVALVCTSLTLCFVFGAVSSLWPGRRDLPALAVGFAALWPVHLGVGASSNNDSLGGLLIAALFYFVARAAAGHWQVRDQVLTGVCAGLAICTKNTALVVIACVLGAALQFDGRRKSTSGMRSVLVVAGVALAVAAPHLVRNTVLYGDPFALRVFSAAATAGTPGYPAFAATVSFIDYWRGMFLMIFATFWGFWGGPGHAVVALAPLTPRPVDPRLGALMLGFVGVKVVALLGFFKLLRGEPSPQSPAEEKEQATGATDIVIRWWTVAAVLVVLAWVQFAYQHFSGGQARYLHAALVPMAALLAATWTAFWGRGRGRLLASGAFGLLLLTMNLLNILNWKTLN